MSLQLNKFIIAGNLARDPELRLFPNDRSVANFTVITNRRWKDQATGEPREEATAVDCEAWGKTAELLGAYFSKGTPIYLEGRMKQQRWEQPDGQKRSKLVCVVDDVRFVESAHKGKGEAAKPAPAPVRERTDDDRYAESAGVLGGTTPPPAPQAGPRPGDDEPPF